MPQSPLIYIYIYIFSCIVRRCNSGLWAKLVRRGGGMRKGRAEKLFNMFVCFFNPPYATRTLMPHLVLEIKSASCYLFVFHPTPNSRSQRKTHFIFKPRLVRRIVSVSHTTRPPVNATLLNTCPLLFLCISSHLLPV